MENKDFRVKSFWLGTHDYIPRKPLKADIDVDVAIVGGGFTGLSSAYHPKKGKPGLNVVLL